MILIIESYPNHSWVATSSDRTSQYSIICIIHYLLSHLWHEIVVFFSKRWPWSHFLKAQTSTRVVPKDHDMSNPSFWYPLEWNDWTPQYVKVNIQNLCTNIIFFAWWNSTFHRDVASHNKKIVFYEKKKFFEHPKFGFKYECVIFEMLDKWSQINFASYKKWLWMKQNGN